MRALPIVLSLLVASTAFAQGPPRERGRTRDDVGRYSLTADQVQRYASSYHPGITACYVAHARDVKRATGHLALKLTVRTDGWVRNVAVEAPGVRGKQLRNLQDCVRWQVMAWHFPVRRDLTNAVLPYYFVYLDVPGGGPQYSCWNQHGCQTRQARRR